MVYFQLDSDCKVIIKNLADKNIIPKEVWTDFSSTFKNVWPKISEKIANIGDSSRSADLTSFRIEHKGYLKNGILFYFNYFFQQ